MNRVQFDIFLTWALDESTILKWNLNKVCGRVWTRPLGRPWRRWGDNIKIDVGETVEGCGLDSSGSPRDQGRALVNTVMNLLVP
jgi:hypothetical protein